MKTNNKFLRQCVSCKELKNKDDLIKITKDFKTGEISINSGNKITGRSVYICNKIDCIKMAVKKKKIENSLKVKNIESIKENLCTVLKN